MREFVNMEGNLQTASFDIRDGGWHKCFDCGHTATNDHPVSNIRIEGSWIVWDEPAVKNNDYGYSIKASQDGGQTWVEESFYGGNQTEMHFMRFAPGHYDTIEIKTFLPEGCCDHEVGSVTASIDLTVIEKQAETNATMTFIPMGDDTYAVEINGFTPGNWADFSLAMGSDGRDQQGSWGTAQADDDGYIQRDDIRFYWDSPVTMEELLTDGYYDLYEFGMQFDNNGKSVTMTRISHGGWTKSVIRTGGGGGSVKTYPVTNVRYEQDGEKYGPDLRWDVPAGVENKNVGYQVEIYNEDTGRWAWAETEDDHMTLIWFGNLEAGHYTKLRIYTRDYDRGREIGIYKGDIDLTVDVEYSLQAPNVVLEDKDRVNGDGYPGYRVWITGVKKDWRYGVNFLEYGERYGRMRYIKVDDTGLGGCEGTVYLPIWDESELDCIEFSLYAMDGHTVDENTGKVTAKMIVAEPVKADFIWDSEPVDAIYFQAASKGLLDYIIPKNLDDSLSRLDIAKMIAGYMGLKVQDGRDPGFSDCTNLSAREKAVIAAVVDANILKGNNGTFAPYAKVTRAEVAVVLSNLLGRITTSYDKEFDDVSAGIWYYSYVTNLYNLGVITVEGNTFQPNKAATNAVVLEWLLNASEI